MSALELATLDRCFQGILPSTISTCSKDGIPNTSALSQVHRVDDRHVAVSCQFFNKTTRNLAENPHAELHVLDPLDMQDYILTLKMVRSETSGPLFDTMAPRLDAIAALSGMQGVFRLRSADVFEVTAIERGPAMIRPATDASEPPPQGPYHQLRALQVLAQRMSQARDLDGLLDGLFGALAEAFGFPNGMLLVPEGDKLVTVASFGYGASGAGAEVALGEGIIGTVAQQRRPLRVGNVASERRYQQAIRGQSGAGWAEIPLPGLPDAHSQAAVPLLVGDQLVGVLFLESPGLLAFDAWSEALLDILGYHVALGIDRFSGVEDEAGAAAPPQPAPPTGPRRSFTLFRHDDCVFMDGSYLIRNVPGLILWKLLSAHHAGQREFSNRELRLDPALKLPPLRDNLESRLILLRKRLETQCPDVRLVPVKRGRFSFQVSGQFQLTEKP